MALFSEKEIRPPNVLVGQQIAIRQDIGFLLSRYDQFVKTACPACRGVTTKPHLAKHGFTYDLCNSCGTVFMNPRAPEAVLADFYRASANYAYWNKYIFPASATVRRERIFRPRVEKIIDICERHTIRMGVLVEIGSGFGTFLEEMTLKGAFETVLGIEPTPDLARTCREKGLKIVERTVEEAARDGTLPQADVIVSFEVIEHLFDPGAFVEYCGRLLVPGGVFVSTCPNWEGFDLQVLGTVSDAIDHEHVNYFTPSSIATLCRDRGLIPLGIETTGELDAEIVRNKVLEGRFSLDSNPFLKRVLVDRWEDLGGSFQEFLKKSNLSSNMTIVAIKPRLDDSPPSVS